MPLKRLQPTQISRQEVNRLLTAKKKETALLRTISAAHQKQFENIREHSKREHTKHRQKIDRLERQVTRQVRAARAAMRVYFQQITRIAASQKNTLMKEQREFEPIRKRVEEIKKKFLDRLPESFEKQLIRAIYGETVFGLSEEVIPYHYFGEKYTGEPEPSEQEKVRIALGWLATNLKKQNRELDPKIIQLWEKLRSNEEEANRFVRSSRTLHFEKQLSDFTADYAQKVVLRAAGVMGRSRAAFQKQLNELEKLRFVRVPKQDIRSKNGLEQPDASLTDRNGFWRERVVASPNFFSDSDVEAAAVRIKSGARTKPRVREYGYLLNGVTVYSVQYVRFLLEEALIKMAKELPSKNAEDIPLILKQIDAVKEEFDAKRNRILDKMKIRESPLHHYKQWTPEENYAAMSKLATIVPREEGGENTINPEAN